MRQMGARGSRSSRNGTAPARARCRASRGRPLQSGDSRAESIKEGEGKVVMRNIALFVLVATTSLPGAPLLASQLTGAAAQPQTVIGRPAVSSAQAQINGTVVTPAGEPVGNAVVRARNLLTGDIG